MTCKNIRASKLWQQPEVDVDRPGPMKLQVINVIPYENYKVATTLPQSLQACNNLVQSQYKVVVTL